MNIAPVTSSRIKLVFFDLDGTLTKTDTDWIWGLWRRWCFPAGTLEFLWLRRLFREFRRGRMNQMEYLAYHRYRAFILGPRRYRFLADKFFKYQKDQLIREEMREILDFYRSAGIPMVMITAQNRIMAEAFAREFGFTNLISNEYEQHAATRFGRLKSPVCFGEGKTVLARLYAGNLGISLEQCGFYSDSIHDFPLLSAAGYSVVVDPDDVLKNRAVDKGWPIIQFTEIETA